jgi:hypothetical protein
MIGSAQRLILQKLTMGDLIINMNIELDNINKLMHSVPFGNSHFQNVSFTAGKEGSARRARHLLLQIDGKLKALKSAEFARRNMLIDIEELKEKNAVCVNRYQVERNKVEIEKKQYEIEGHDKLIEDAQIEIMTFYNELKTIPEFTREEFEGEELNYWKKRIMLDARREMLASGNITVATIKSLSDVGISIGKNQQGQICFNIPENELKLLLEDK